MDPVWENLLTHCRETGNYCSLETSKASNLASPKYLQARLG